MNNPLARLTDPPTSHAAARMARRLVADHSSRILYALKHGGPGTCYDVARRCIGMDHVAAARRLGELRDAGDIRDTGRTAPSPAGRPCTIWEWIPE